MKPSFHFTYHVAFLKIENKLSDVKFKKYKETFASSIAR